MQLDEAVLNLRRDLLDGRYGPGARLAETALARTMGVSRTLVRLALAEIEREGLVHRLPRRGYRVRSFALDEVVDAILVRGELEGMAARLAAERGLDRSARANLAMLLAEMDAARDFDPADIAARRRWTGLNGRFHDALLEAAGNVALPAAVAFLSRVPLAAATAIVFDTGDAEATARRLRRSHAEHHDVVDAVLARQGARAEAIMREHARRSASNKRLDAMILVAQAETLPGLALVRTG